MVVDIDMLHPLNIINLKRRVLTEQVRVYLTLRLPLILLHIPLIGHGVLQDMVTKLKKVPYEGMNLNVSDSVRTLMPDLFTKPPITFNEYRSNIISKKKEVSL